MNYINIDLFSSKLYFYRNEYDKVSSAIAPFYEQKTILQANSITTHLPAQMKPVPVNPLLQEQVYPPGVL